MGETNHTVNPNMLILGREARGFSQKELAEKLGMTQGRISKIEQGLLVFPDEFLDKLVSVLRFPAQFFFQSGDLVGVGVAEIFHRKRQDVPKSELAKIYAQMEIRLRHLYVLQGEKSFYFTVNRFNVDEDYEDIEEIARSIRKDWKLPRGPIDNLTKVIEQAGILVIPVDFGTKRVDAISRWVPGLPPVMFVNIHSPADRYRYSLAHELGHIVMHQLPNPKVEEQADRFAAEFLLPGEEIRPELSDVSLPKLARLKSRWKVSMAALLVRAQRLGTISNNQARYLWMQMAKLGYKTREPIELDIKEERPSLLKEQIETFLKMHGDSITSLSEALAFNEDEFRVWYLCDHGQPPSHKIPLQA